jgi:hypothetical protein
VVVVTGLEVFVILKAEIQVELESQVIFFTFSLLLTYLVIILH